MKRYFIFGIFVFLLSSTIYSDTIFKIEPNDNYQKYSDKDLRRRVWQLEQAVWQLQQKVFELSTNLTPVSPSTAWTCSISVFSNRFTETRPTKTEAKYAALDKCTKAYSSISCKEDKVSCGN